MNKQSNTYTIIYIIVMVVVVGAALAFTSISLKDRQQANADADKMRQILASVNVEVSQDEITDEYNRLITNTFVVDSEGNRVADAPDAFSINVALQSKEATDKRLLPVYECTLSDGSVKYILSMYGAGLWGADMGAMPLSTPTVQQYMVHISHIRARLLALVLKSKNRPLATSSKASTYCSTAISGL